jgi:1,4-dihydroxy-2-naphthoyl-CoA hydrolase
MARKIWHGDYTVDEANGMISPQNILGCLGLQFTALGDDYIEATLPVDTRTHQPYGILHGGATCVLAETLGSVASLLVVNRETQFAVGSVITANHLRPVSSGHIRGVCRPVHLGRTKHVWEIMVHSDQGKLVAKCELTCAITPRQASE